jgi:predicted alpha/beta superfamily hydrolase
MRRQTIGLTLFLAAPVLIVAILTYILAHAVVQAPIASSSPRPAPAQPAAARLVAAASLETGFVLVVRDESGLVTASSPLYLASNHNGWNPGDPAQKLAGRSDGRWQIVLPKPTNPEPLQFKFTRGSWDWCEVSADLADIANRTLPKVDANALKPGEPAVIEFTIPKFADQRPGAATGRAVDDPTREMHVTGTVRRLEVVGGGSAARGRRRDLLVWLPPGYDAPENAQRRYPVLYMQDGQNIFEQLPGVPGEWKADETATRLIGEGKVEPLIIVGIPNAGRSRAGEYSPVPLVSGMVADADGYVAFLLSEVLPRTRRAFRVKDGPENTGVGGSSLGGLLSLYAATKHPEVFGKVLSESPTLVLPGRGLALWRGQFEPVRSWPSRVFIGMGGREEGPDPSKVEANSAHVQAARELDALLGERGVAPEARRLVVVDDAAHTEQAWAARLGGALEFLFPAR